MYIFSARPPKTHSAVYIHCGRQMVFVCWKKRDEKKNTLRATMYMRHIAISHLLAIWVVCMAKKTENVQFARRTQCAPKKLRDVCSSLVVVLLSPCGRLGS